MSSTTPDDEGLIRALTVPTLTASIVNATIGAGIFVLPAAVAAGLGAAAPVAFVVCAIAMAFVVTTFAIAGSRVSLTGGLYAYVEVAFGSYVGFLAGTFLWLTNLLSGAAVSSALAAAVGSLIPFVRSGIGRFLFILVIFSGLALINIRGVRAGARTVATITIAKLAPLLVFIIAGVFFLQPGSLVIQVWPASGAFGETVLLLMFAFMGVELALVPSGEVRNPARTVPRSIFLALGITTLVYIAVQLVAQGVLGGKLAGSTDAPLAEAASRFLGGFGRSLLLVGGAISAFGYISGEVLGAPRTLYAMARDGILPAKMAAIHSRYRTPHVAIVAHVAITFALAITSTFNSLAVLANVAALLVYLLCCAAALELIRRGVRADGAPWRMPGERVVPVIACAIIIWILAHASAREFIATAAVVAIATLLFVLRRATRRIAHDPPSS